MNCTNYYRKKRIEFSSFGLSISEKIFIDCLATIGKSWVEKAAKEGEAIYLKFRNEGLIVEGSPGNYDAAIAADFLRYQLIQQNDTFTFETVLSDVRKIKFLQEARNRGFKIYLYFVCTRNPEINIRRVANRVAKGGHNVPPAKIKDRYYSSLAVLAALIPHTHRYFLIDNSEEGNAINLLAEIEKGERLTIESGVVPSWAQEYVLDKLF